MLIVGLVCERMGSFGGLETLSLWPSVAKAKGNVAGLCAVLVVGESVPSSNNVSIARSKAPVDFAVVRAVYADVPVEAERLRIGGRGDAEDDEDDEYLDSEFPMDLAMDGKRTMLVSLVDGSGGGNVGLFRSSSSLSEFA